jgi:hypothetical protein
VGAAFFMPEIPLPLQQPKDEICEGINEGKLKKLFFL